MTFAEPMAAVVRQSAALMKSSGFRKRRHSFNRMAGDGLVHVLSFQMGSFDPSGSAEIPGLRPNLYGKFTVNLGVFVPAMARMGLPKSDWVNDYNCQIRKRLGELLPEQTDIWWNLEYVEAADDVERELTAYAVPWLDQFNSYDHVINVFESEGRGPLGMPPAAALDMADLYLAIGERSKAHDLLGDYAPTQHTPGHADVIERFLESRGFGDLLPRVNRQPKPPPRHEPRRNE